MSELIAFVALFYWGATTGPLALNIILAVCVPGAAVAVWARWCAPKASTRLHNPALTVVELSVFLVAALAIALSISILLALLFAILVCTNAWVLASLGLGEA
ncbi:MAG TPA: DUF2568 domain-containing protein [Baekduia sp.]|nr:DUF2568 domain-containing protein [Baekduia sp.]